MKKIVVLSIVMALVLALVGCSSGDADYKLGQGVITTIGSSYNAEENDDGEVVGRAQADTIIASVMIDGEGKVVSVNIDTAQTAIYFDGEGVITSDVAAEYKTKKERGDDYGMIKASGIGREWYEQIEALEEWMIGKTSAEISDIALDEEGRPTDVDLSSKATVHVDGYVAAVVKAIENAG